MTFRRARRIARLWLAVTLTLVAVACSASRQEGPLPPRGPRTSVRFDNRSPAQVTVYAIRAGQRIRLGQAQGSTTTVLTIPESAMLGTTTLRFQVDPLGGAAQTSSYEVIVSPGEQIVIIYP